MSQRARSALLALCALALPACPAAVSDPPPPPRKAEILPAPPRALGAHAAGTDAAPKPELVVPGGVPEVAPEVTPPPEAGSPDAGSPDAGAAPRPAPDAGTAL